MAQQAGRVAWVTGASRGVGRGVALALGRAGWTVYVTARSSAAGRTGHLPGTVEECAEAVTASGGHGVAVICDHRDDDAAAAVADRIMAAHGRLDVLVNNAWGGYERLNAGAWEEWNAPLWEQPIELFDARFTGGVRAHYVTLARCAPLLIATPGSAVVTVSFTVTDAGGRPPGAAYAAAKCADDRLALAAAAHRLSRPSRAGHGRPAPAHREIAGRGPGRRWRSPPAARPGNVSVAAARRLGRRPRAEGSSTAAAAAAR